MREKNSLRAFDQLTVDNFRAAQCRRPKRQIKNVMQSEQAEDSQERAIYQRADITCRREEIAARKNYRLKARSNDVDQNSQSD